MFRIDGAWWYSASDVLAWRGCAHRTTLDARMVDDPGLRAELATTTDEPADELGVSAFSSPAARRGDEHEQAMLATLIAEGRRVVTIERPDPLTEAALLAAAEQTESAMESGADVVFQAALVDEPWLGYADFLVRVDGVPSRLGDYAYEVRDTKLARHASASALLQMAHYGDAVARIQGVEPPRLAVWLGTGELVSWPFADAAPYLEIARQRFLDFRSAGTATRPVPVTACPGCRWLSHCDAEWGPTDLRHVHRLTRRQRTLLRESGITDIALLASATDHERPPGVAAATFARLRAQAAVQAGDEPYVVVRPQPALALRSVPAPDGGDVYFDLEGDPFAAIPTLDYLWAYCDPDGTYHHQWAHSPDAELAAFAWFVGLLDQRDAAGGDWHVFHYNTYEVTSLTRIAASWPDEIERGRWVELVERLVRDRFVDLFRVVEAGVRTRAGSTSLKVVEQLAGYDRSGAEVSRADESIEAYEAYLLQTDQGAAARILVKIAEYNAHDVRATAAVHRWLRALAAGLDDADVEPAPEEYTPSPAVADRIAKTAALRDTLIAAAAHGPLTSGLTAGGARRLAHMLEWHRAESVVQYVDHLRLRDWAAGEAGADAGDEPARALEVALNGDAVASRVLPGTEHESCLLDVELVSVGPPTSSRANARRPHEFRCRPGSWRIKAGSHVVLAQRAVDGPDVTFEIDDIDPRAGTFTVLRQHVPPRIDTLVLSPFWGPDAVWESLMRLADAALVADPPSSSRVGFDLLDARPPLGTATMSSRDDEPASARGQRLVAEMTHGVLPVQGPPGTGKTWLAARLVLDAVRRGGRDGQPPVVAVTANSHRVIDNLLRAVIEAAHDCDLGVELAVGHAGAKDELPAGVLDLGSNGDVAAWVAAQCDAGLPVVVGATKYAWARPELAGIADLLVIDEAGQFAFADAVAVTPAAPVVVALGDPQQLAAPIQAAHDPSVSMSMLAHLAAGADVLPAEVGVFLDTSYRMHPALCAVVGDLAYGGQLRSSDEAAARGLRGPDLRVAGTLVVVQPGVAWVPVNGGPDAEVAAVHEAIAGLVGKATVVDGGTSRLLTTADVLVVAPHNAHVNRIAAALGAGVRVGTVDKFQGQEGDVVVYSMGRVAEEPGDVTFLYELNRLNVALSRARLLSVVVAQPDALFPPVATPDQLRLASRFIRAVT